MPRGRHWPIVLIGLAFAIFLTHCQAAFAKTSEASGGKPMPSMASDLEEERLRRNIPGLAVVIVRSDQIVFMEGFGLRDVDQKLLVTSDTLFVIGSCTKAFTAMAAVMSQDDGKLSVDDHPRRFLPYFKLRDTEANSRITIRDLLCHRSGLPYEDDSLWKNKGLRREEIIKAGMMAEPTAPLGKKFQYNNVLFTAAGQAVAAAQDSTWEKMIATRIFAPLGMNASMTSQRESARDHSCAYLPGKAAPEDTDTGLPRSCPSRRHQLECKRPWKLDSIDAGPVEPSMGSAWFQQPDSMNSLQGK